MAPQTVPVKGLQQNRPRPTVPRPIIPAIPLPYVQKRKQQEAVRAKAKEEAAVPVIVDTPTSAVQPAVDDIAPAVVNGSHDRESAEQKSTVEESKVSAHEEVLEQPQETPKSAPSETQSNASRSTYHMPPAFVPANQNQFNGADDPAKQPSSNTFNGQHPMHHAHPSAGSMVFGGEPESNNSSPAPLSEGYMPPPSFHNQQLPQHRPSRHGPHQSNGGQSQQPPNGCSPMGPPPPPGYYPGQNGFMNQGPTADNFARRQMVSFGPPEGYAPASTPLPIDGRARMNSFDLPTPHSFHGSQSSATNDQESSPAFYGQYPTAVISNGSNGHVDEVRLYQQPRPKPRAGPQAAAAPNGFAHMPPPSMSDHLDGLVPYIQSQFADSSFADYTLELRYSDDRAPPVRIPGHNLIFARSPTLKNLMTAQARDSNSDNLIVRTLLLESDDRFLRSDGFWMAVQRLYGCPLLEFGPITHLNVQHAAFSGPMPGAPQDRFDLALGYAAAGSLLQIPPVIARGIEIAAHLVNWLTVEKALDFAVDGGLDSQWTLSSDGDKAQPSSTYGPAVNILIHNALNFIITAFPAGFELDTFAPEPIHNRRLPLVQETRGPGQNPRLSLIKFGDHPSEESMRSSNTNAVTSTLSKILLNLPFQLLKYVLESSRLGNVQGWATTALRTKVMHCVIAEREKRRTKVLSSHVPNVDRKTKSKEWESVGWQESVVPLDGNEATPTLTRTWVNFTRSEY